MKNVLLATDGSSHAEDAARFLSHLPHEEKLELTVLTVLEAPYVNFHYPTSDWIQEAVELEKVRAVESFHKIEALFEGANVDLKHIVREGTRATTILEVAKEIKSQLIVMGAKGHSTVSRILLGSVSDHVATHAHCSVLVVRPTKNLQSGQPMRIAIGYEDTGPATAALEELSDTNWGANIDVRLVSVVAYLAGMFHDKGFDGAGIKESALETVRGATQQIADSAPNAIATVIESEHVGEGLVVYATEHETDLLVVGETSRSALGRVIMGSVSRFVLRHAPCSVWITRNRFVTGNVSKKSKQKAKVSTS